MALKLISTEPSPCCNADALIVRSRSGGFVSRDCLKCGKSHYLTEGQIPELPCDECATPMQIAKADGTNYFFTCRSCERLHMIADIVPVWSDEFRYSGLAAHGDAGVPF